MGSALNSLDGELAPITPSLATEDSAEIAVVRFVALVESQSSIIEVKSAPFRKGPSLLQIPQDRGLKGRLPLRSLEGAGKTGSASEKIGRVQHGPHGGDAVMARAADPSSFGCFQDTVYLGKIRKQGRRSELSTSLRRDRGGRHDHLREDPLGMQGIRPWLRLEFTKHKKQGVASGTFRGITFRKPHTDMSDSRPCFPRYHLRNITRPEPLSNP